MSGMLMSSRIRSGGSRRAAESASLPLGTGRTLYPRSLSMPARTCRFAGVSSTMRMLAGTAVMVFAGMVVLGGFKWRSRTEEVEKFLVLKTFRQVPQSLCDARVTGFDVFDFQKQL